MDATGPFDRIAVPTPFQVGPVNCYLAGRTLVDPGPESDDARETVDAALADRGLAPGDVARVLVTHPHPDHFGAAARFRAAGATVLAGADAAPILADFAGRLDEQRSYFSTFLRRHGLPASTVETVTELPRAFLPYAPDVTVDRELAGGEVLDPPADGEDDGDDAAPGGSDGTPRLSVRTAAGHAEGELVFEFAPDGGDGSHDAPPEDGQSDGPHAVVGDQVLPGTTPNPFLRPPGDDGERPRVLPAYNESLRRLRDRGYGRLLPGHGEPIADPAARIDAILAANADRTAAVAAFVADAGPVTAADVMAELFGDLPATEAFSGMSEAVGHLDVCEARGVVRRTGDDPVRFVASDDAAGFHPGPASDPADGDGDRQ